MQKNTDKEKKRKGEGPPTAPLAQLGRPPAQPTSPARPLPCSPDRGRNRGSPRRTPSPATGRIRMLAPPASSGPSPTHPRSPLGLCASLFPPDPRRSSLPHARRGRRRSPSFPRPPCPPRRPTVSPRTAVARCIVWCSPLETGAPATTSPSSSSPHGRRRSPPRFAASSLPRAHSRRPAGSM